jgi:DnaJ-domain-containing protein 1
VASDCRERDRRCSPMSLRDNPFRVLGISPEADARDIEKAYDALRWHWHPDRNQRPEATERFVELTEARNELLDPIKRAAWVASYDAVPVGTGVGSSPTGADREPSFEGDPPWTPPPERASNHGPSASSNHGDPLSASAHAPGQASPTPRRPPATSTTPRSPLPHARGASSVPCGSTQTDNAIGRWTSWSTTSIASRSPALRRVRRTVAISRIKSPWPGRRGRCCGPRSRLDDWRLRLRDGGPGRPRGNYRKGSLAAVRRECFRAPPALGLWGIGPATASPDNNHYPSRGHRGSPRHCRHPPQSRWCRFSS